MKFFKTKLTAGVGSPIGATGRYFRVLSGSDDLRVTFEFEGGKTHSTMWKVGIGATLDKSFTRVTLESETTQTVEIAYGNGTIDDSRLTGDIDINGLLAVVNAGGVSYGEKITDLTSTTVETVAATNTDRILGTLVINTSGRLWYDNTVSATKGIPYTANTKLEIKNTAALYFYPSADGTAHLLEDLKS